MSFLDFQLRLSLRTAPKWLFLKTLSLIYGGLIHLWLFLYRSGLKKSASVKTPVISVGNPTVGGTGKTPLINWFLEYCAQRNLKAATLTRGYKSKNAGKLRILDENTKGENWENYGDEPWLLFKNHPRQTFYICENRIISAKLAENKVDLIFLDDGMQHLKLNRDLNIVLIDATVGVGNGSLLPLGPLREPLSCLKRADAVIYTRTNLKSSASIRRALAPSLPPNAPQFDSRYYPLLLISSKDSSSLKISAIKQKKCLLFSGVGNPESFAAAIRQAGGRVTGSLTLADHQEYNDRILQKLNDFILKSPDSDLIVCTEKDWVKLEGQKDKLPEFYRLKMEMSIDEEFNDFLRRRLAV